ncbi:MAG: hypothetical protein IPG97_14190 [Microthrixaceae bacterium]|nr:hypothetical protein [Microthrixaceae bacterium]
MALVSNDRRPSFRLAQHWSEVGWDFNYHLSQTDRPESLIHQCVKRMTGYQLDSGGAVD